MKIRVLGIDPGTAIVGWAVLDCVSDRVRPVRYGQIVTAKELSDAERLSEVAADLEEIVRLYRPQEAAVEKLFFFKNQKTIITVSQSRGVILQVLHGFGVRVFEYTPLQVKQAVTGYGRADKTQVQQMVKNIAGLKQVPQPDDVADALAVGICHAAGRRLKEKTV